MITGELRHALRKIRGGWMRATALAAVAGVGSAFFFAVLAIAWAILYRAAPIDEPHRLFAAEWISDTSIQKVAPAGTLRYLDLGGIGNTKTGNTFPWSVWEAVQQEGRQGGGDEFAAWAPLGKAWYGVADIAIRYQNRLVVGRADMVSPSYFSVIGVRPLRGRLITSESLDASVAPAVVSERFWRTQLGADASAIGSKLEIDKRVFTVVGVADRGFDGLIGGVSTDVWVPFQERGVRFWGQENCGPATCPSWSILIAIRVRNTGGIDATAGKLSELLNARLAGVPHAREDSPRVVLKPALDSYNLMAAVLTTPLIIMIVLAGMVLLAAIATGALLALEKAIGRQQELKMRLALGSSRRRILAGIAFEWMAVAAAASVCSALLVVAMVPWITGFVKAAGDPYGFGVEQINLRNAFVYAVAGPWLICTIWTLIEVLTSIAAQKRGAVLQTQQSYSLSDGYLAMMRMAMVGQVAFSVVAFALSIIAVSAARAVLATDPGFQPRGLFIFGIHASSANILNNEEVGTFLALRDTIQAIPGVEGVTASVLSPAYARGAMVRIKMPAASASSDHAEHAMQQAMVRANMVAPDYFSTYQIALIDGRPIEVADGTDGKLVAVVSAALAERVFGHQDVVGDVIETARGERITVVGVAANAVYESIYEMAERPSAVMYVPLTQRPPAGFDHLRFAVKWRGAAAPIEGRIRELISSQFVDLAMDSPRNQVDVLNASMWQERLVAQFGVVASVTLLSLCAVGIATLVAANISRRTREIGIRVALGTTRLSLYREICGRMSVWLGIGLAAGIWLAISASKVVSARVHGMQKVDDLTLAIVAITVVGLGVTSSISAMKRASAMDPASALKRIGE